MDCYCHSKDLYSSPVNSHLPILTKNNTVTLEPIQDDRLINKYHKRQTNNLEPLMVESILENSEIYLTNRVDRISADEMFENPMWFYKNYIAKNKPCVISGVALDWTICEQWASPK